MKNIATALVKAQGIAKGVEKDARNDFHKYKYASAESMVEEGRQALTAAGLALLTLGWEPMDASGRAPRVKVRYLLVHGESGESMTLESSSPVIPEKGRPEDKAEFGALTENLGYFLRGLLLIPRVDEETTVSGRDDRTYQPPPKAAVPPPQRQPAPVTPPAPVKVGPKAQEFIDKIKAASDKAAVDSLLPSLTKARESKVLVGEDLRAVSDALTERNRVLAGAA